MRVAKLAIFLFGMLTPAVCGAAVLCALAGVIDKQPWLSIALMGVAAWMIGYGAGLFAPEKRATG